MAVSAASAMSLKRSFSGLDLAADARAARARRSAQPSNKEGLEDPTLETPLKDTGLPPSPDKTSPILNDLGPVALPRIGKKERFSKPCPRHRQAGHRAGPHQYCSKPFNCGCCMGTCHLCEPAKNLWSPSTRLQSMMAAKRAEQMKQYNQQYKDAAEQAETSKLPGAYWAELSKATIKLGPFGADPFGDGAASEDLPQKSCRCLSTAGVP